MKGILKKGGDILRFISIGKHHQGLYFNGVRQYSTVLGGIVTLFLSAFMIYFTVTQLSDIFLRKTYNLELKLAKFDNKSRIA
jgi:hypothetical protein